jgi:DNA-binding NtrC family response regulator
MATILLVDDDPLQASIRKTILERRFSDIRRVGDAAAALCLIEQPQFARNLGLVISGHHHSGIGVPAFVAELHTRMPELPVLVLDDNADDDDDFPGDAVYFLHRPVRAEEILSMAIEMMTQSERKTA